MNPTKTYRIATWLLWLMTLVGGNLYAGSLQTGVPVVEQEQSFVLAEDIFSATVYNAEEVSVAEYGEKVADIALFIVTGVGLDEYKELVDNTTNVQITALTTKLTIIHGELTAIKDSLNNKTVIDIAGFTTLVAVDYVNIQTKIKAFYTEQKKVCNELNILASELKNKVSSIGYGNVLLQDGFCDLELDLINAFLNADSRIQWGGKFNSKIDGMHFGFTSSAAKEIVNKK